MTLTHPQIRALDVVQTFSSDFSQQAAGLYAIWPRNQYRQKNLQQLEKEGYLEWIPSYETSYGARWWCTDKGTVAVIDQGKAAGVR